MELKKQYVTTNAGDAGVPEFSEERNTLYTRHLVKTYGKRTVANDVSISVRQGEIVGLLGPNGAGTCCTQQWTSIHQRSRNHERPGIISRKKRRRLFGARSKRFSYHECRRQYYDGAGDEIQICRRTKGTSGETA